MSNLFVVFQHLSKRAVRRVQSQTEVSPTRDPNVLCTMRGSVFRQALFLKARKNPKGLSITFEAAIILHQIVECRLPIVAEWWMAKVVRQRSELDEVGIYGIIF